MTRRKTWTTGDFRRVAELAGTMPSREVRRRLRLSKRQLRYAVELLRRAGAHVTTRYYEPRLRPCPACGRMSATLDERGGICEPCRLARQLAAVEWRISELMPRLTPGQRATYEGTESGRESGADPMPRPSPTGGLDAYERARAEEEYEAATERWLARCLSRRVRAAQKRKERIEMKVNENERSDKDADNGAGGHR